MKVAVLGAGGFIGSHIVERLISTTDHEVVGLDITDEKLGGLEADFEFYRVDVRDSADLVDRLVRDADVVVDLIAHANPSMYVSSPAEVFELNFIQNLDVIQACRRHGTRIIVYSTSEVYGRPTGETYSEDTSDLIMGPVSKHRWIYASAKQMLERAVHAYGLAGELEYTILRPFNFVGPRIDYLVPSGTRGGPRVLSHFISALLTGGPMYLVDGGTVHRSFTHIHDATDAFMILLENPGAANEIFNVGNPAVNVTVRELATMMKSMYESVTGLESSCEFLEISGEEFYGPGYEDTDRVPPDISKLRALGYEPKRGLRQTLEDTIRYYIESDHQDILVASR